jgi:hypothetical protein
MEMNSYRWFHLKELGVHPDAPTDGSLVWICYAGREHVTEATYTLHRWELDEETKERLRAKSVAEDEFWGWVVSEQAFNHYLRVGDRVSRVLIPEPPTL